MESVVTRAPELAELVESAHSRGSGWEEASAPEPDILAYTPPIGRSLGQGTIAVLLGVQIAWLALLAVALLSLLR
jgi:hypothetical protein